MRALGLSLGRREEQTRVELCLSALTSDHGSVSAVDPHGILPIIADFWFPRKGMLVNISEFI